MTAGVELAQDLTGKLSQNFANHVEADICRPNTFYFYLRPRTRHTLGAEKFDDAPASHLGCRQSRDFHEQKFHTRRRASLFPGRVWRDMHVSVGNRILFVAEISPARTRRACWRGKRKHEPTLLRRCNSQNLDMDAGISRPCEAQELPSDRRSAVRSEKAVSEVMSFFRLSRWQRCQFAFRLGCSQRHGPR